MIRKTLALAAAAATVLALPASAHHSFAMFDSSKTRVLKGRVVEFRWTNPHVGIFVQRDDVSGREGLWAVELTSPGNLKRVGWDRTSLKRGDRVEVTINPLRDGRHGGGFREITLLDTGQTLTGSLIDIERNLRGQ